MKCLHISLGNKMPRKPIPKARAPLSPSLSRPHSCRTLPNHSIASQPSSQVHPKGDLANATRGNLAKDADLSDGDFENLEWKISDLNMSNDVSCYTRTITDENEDSSIINMTTSSSSQINHRWSYIGKKELRAWYQLPDGHWVLGRILSTFGTKVIFSVLEGSVLDVNPECLLPANPDILDGVNDLMQLSYLNEPSVLYNLQVRYLQDMIYSKAGPVLIAINPFKQVSLYGNKVIEAYRQGSLDAPHVYDITDFAFREMIRDQANQSIIISGESGAGKTETAKIAMQYLAAVGGGGGIEHEILQTNPLLEAFGNAKTLQNDNSSRFGKMIEIYFQETRKISGAKIQTFLLEKSRVVQRTKGERSYHIFYQLCAGAPLPLKEKLNLKEAREYNYLKQSGCFSLIGVNDAARFHIVMKALDSLHVCKKDQERLFSMLTAILWLGNISFIVIDNENHVEVVDDGSVYAVANLIGCSTEDLKINLSTRKLKVGSDNIVQKLTLLQAIDKRDALAKCLYTNLFDWLVEQINKSLGDGKHHTERSINILDIYGFECYERNGFEQFCINYANERLQQHFNHHLFKVEQEEYNQDGIDWARVEFEDNQDCLDLFEKKPLGLLSLLDEESTFPNGTDLTFANKLEQHLSSNSCFHGEKGKSAFHVSHYAGEVMYDTSGFLEKNRDVLDTDSIQFLSSCSGQLTRMFAINMLIPSEKGISHLQRTSGVDSQKLSVAAKFKGQLFQLMERIEITTPHFIRCIKPNDLQLPGMYEQVLVLHQLRCCGVLEVVRISRSGYPTRISHQKFAKRYGFLLSKAVASQDPLSVSIAILRQFNVLPDMYQVGYTKLFLRTGQISLLEDTRNSTLYGILKFQSCFRGHKVRCYMKAFRKAILMLQSFIRGDKQRHQYHTLLLRHRAATTIQKHLKSQNMRTEFVRLRHATIVIQSAIRGWSVRRCSIDVDLLNQTSAMKGKKEFIQTDETLLNPLILAQLQRRLLKIEASVREKEENNEILQQKLQQYENRWPGYEMKMKSMEDLWQKQMISLQCSIMKGSTSDEVVSKSVSPEKNEDCSWNVNQNHIETSDSSRHRLWSGSCTRDRERSVEDMSIIRRMREEFEQRTQTFGDDVEFLVEVKSGQVEASMNPERELRRLKQIFKSWKKDYNLRLQESRALLRKVAEENEDNDVHKGNKHWWGKRSSRPMMKQKKVLYLRSCYVRRGVA